MQKIEKTETKLDVMYSLWNELCSYKQSIDKDKTASVANKLMELHAMDFESAHFIAANLAAHAKNLYSTNAAQINADVEAVQIEWISNGILARGKDANGPFCNYYRDTSTFTSQHLGGKTFEFVKGKEPVTGDKCVIYFGITDLDSE